VGDLAPPEDTERAVAGDRQQHLVVRRERQLPRRAPELNRSVDRLTD
jgi:hypothetical protein